MAITAEYNTVGRMVAQALLDAVKTDLRNQIFALVEKELEPTISRMAEELALSVHEMNDVRYGTINMVVRIDGVDKFMKELKK